MTLTLRYAARSDRGLVRANNEDSVYAGPRLLALADGMGGHAAGEVASQLVIAALAQLDNDDPGGDLLGKLDRAVRVGNSAIGEQVEQDPDLDGMGTTLTAILFAGDRLGLVHIGDSRGYLLRDGELTQITKDDTFVQTLVDEGRITADEAHSHPQRSLIMRALTGHEVEPTLIMREAREGDRYLLCSDGLSDPVRHDTILEAMQIPEVEAAAERLIELALRGGGPDNVTVVVADVVDNDYAGQTQPILAGAVSADDDDDAAPPNTAAGRASAIAPRPPAAKKVAPEQDPPPKPRSRKRTLLAAALVLLIALGGLGIGYKIIRGYYYVSADGETVAIMRGVQGSVLGIPLQSPYLLGCINDRGELSQISYGQDHAGMGCELMRLQDLRPSAREQVSTGLPAGSLDEAIGQLNELARGSLLPLCAPPPTPSRSTASTSPRSVTPSPPSSTSTETTTTTTTAPATTTAPGTTTTTSTTAPTTTASGTGTSGTPASPTSPVTTLPAAPQKPGTDCRAAA